MLHADRRLRAALLAIGLLGAVAIARGEPIEAARLTPATSVLQSGGFIRHAGRLLDYNGAATCQECHAQEVQEFGVSNHYEWNGKFGVINDFCGYPDINFGPSKLTTVHGTQVDGGCAT